MENYEVKITQKGSPEVLKGSVTRIDDPRMGEVRVKIVATGVAFADMMMRHGLYPGVPSIPFTPGYEMMGVVDALSSETSAFKMGQMVAALTVTGAYARYINLPENQLVPVPDGLDPYQAACLPLNYVTAWQMLTRVAAVQPNGSVLVHGAAGGVGSALVQLARLSNQTIYGTASTPKHDWLRSQGVIPIDYRQSDFVRTLLSASGGRGVDAAFDGVGGGNLWRSAQALCRGGKLVAYGFLGSMRDDKVDMLNTISTFTLLPVINLLTGKKAMFYSIGDEKQKNLAAYKTDLAGLFDLLKQGKIQPLVARRMPLAQAAEAHRLMTQSAVSGKILLIPD